LPQGNLAIEMCNNEAPIPFVQIGESVVKYIFGTVDSLKNIQIRMDKNYTPHSFAILKTNCQIATKLVIHDMVAKNVVGMIEGKDSKLKDEIVVIGGHYDHVGFLAKHKPGEDYIFNGADDNASGTAGVMAAAKAFSAVKGKPKRSVLFILFAGEEKGLYGSQYYCSKPLFPLNKTVAMLNMDMIGRNGNDSIQIEGDTVNKDLAKIAKEENTKVGLLITPSEEDLFGRSDQYSFFKKDVSAMGFTSGLHKDYHTVRDEPQTINPFKASQISRLVFRTAWVIANEKKHYSIIIKNK
jgi:Zn-dependent M28 family amino/carboxypeptidase